MIYAVFKSENGRLCFCSVKGHAGFADAGQDIVCAAVSSAVQLTANILGEFGLQPKITVGDNVIECICEDGGEIPPRLLNVLKQHFEAILEEFPNTIKIIISEV